MGTMISLSLNGVDIDYGKNRYWTNHHWLFPPDSITDIDYHYADDITETKPGFQTTLGEARFRLCHLGYSLHETRTKFERAVARWNRTANLQLTFEEFRGVLANLNFVSLSETDMEPYVYDFREFLLRRLLSRWDTEDALLEDFLSEHLDFTLMLRCLAERPENLSLMLRWHHQDLVDSGWATIDDLTEVDRAAFIINHTMLVGRLQDQAQILRMDEFDRWLVSEGLARNVPYTKVTSNGLQTKHSTLPGAVRNMIHHPENPHNILRDDALRDSVELLLEVARRLPTPLPGIA